MRVECVQSTFQCRMRAGSNFTHGSAHGGLILRRDALAHTARDETPCTYQRVFRLVIDYTPALWLSVWRRVLTGTQQTERHVQPMRGVSWRRNRMQRVVAPVAVHFKQ